MSKINTLIFLVVIGMLLISGCAKQPAAAADTASKIPSTATPEPLPEIDPAMEAAMKLCGNIVPGQACLVEGPVQVEAQPESYLMPFREPGQTIPLGDLLRLKLGEAGSTKGVVVMRIQTEWPGGAFTTLAVGDVELVNEAIYGTREFNPMQSLKLTTGENKEDQALVNGLFVASPDDGNLSTLVVNGLELSFGSGGWLTSQGGGLTIQTVWGSIGAWFQDRVIQVKRGFGLKLTHEEIVSLLAKEPSRDAAYETLKSVLAKQFSKKEPYDPAYETVMRALKKYFGCEDAATKGCVNNEDAAADKKYKALEEQRRKQKNWKGGWWKMSYGPTSTTGQCDLVAAGDGGVGGDGEPYSTEIPICRGNNGNTILMYESGTSYDRISPNLFAQSYLTEFDFYGNGNLSREGAFMSLQVVSPTRMILSNTRSQGDSCTTSSVAYLDFVRDDPNIRCGLVIYVDPFETPEAPTPTPEPENVDPPLEGQYQVRLATLPKACDPAAQPFAPNFSTAGLSLSPENKLVVDAASTKYELELSNLKYSYSLVEMDGPKDRLGIFSLMQPADNSFSLVMSLVQMPGQQYTGNWLVANEDGSQLCAGSIDLLPPE